MRRRTALRFLLAALFLFSGALQTGYSVSAIRGLLDRDSRARPPFTLEGAGLRVAGLQPEALEAGLREGDRILSIAGRPLRGIADLAVPVGRLRPGDRLDLTVREGETLSIRVAPGASAPPGPAEWVRALFLSCAMPVLCLMLGFWVAATRVEDPIAWLLLALMMSFSRLTDFTPIQHWDSWWRPAGIAWRWVFVHSWAIWMMLFGVYFPERFFLDRRIPWLKWLFIAPVGLLGAARAVVSVGLSENAAAVAGLNAVTAPLEGVRMALYMFSISTFFMCLGMKQGMTEQPDARRRLLLLHTGTAIGLLPTFGLALRSLLFRREMFDLAEWILVPSLAAMFLFPLTMAYVIVVHRALDVRVVVRQGLQYALARRGVAVLQGLTMVAVLIGMFVRLSQPGTRRVEILGVLGVGATLIVLMRPLAERLRRWLDRRFFREACDAETILNDLGAQVRTIIQTMPLLQTVAARLSESLHVPQVAVLIENGGAYRPAFALGYPEPPDARFDAGSATVEHLRRAPEPLRVYLDDPRSWIHRPPAPGEAEKEALRALNSQLLLPLAAGDRLPGFVSLGAKRSEEPYSGGDVRLLQSVAVQTGLALENSRLTAAVASEVAQRERLNREMEIAREVQERLFPQKLPPVEGLDYRGSCRPALGVGGDYYDFLALPGGRLGIAVADVSGKGIGAALLMASLQASLRGQTIRDEDSLAETISSVSRLVYDASPENRYATFFYGRYDPVTRELRYVNAGHCPPIVLRGAGDDRDVIRLKAGGTVVGLFPESTYKEAVVTLRPGDRIVAYSDGISEALNPDEEEWGEDRLIAAARACDGLGAAETIQRLIQEADAFAAGAPQYDDMTLVVVRVL